MTHSLIIKKTFTSLHRALFAWLHSSFTLLLTLVLISSFSSEVWADWPHVAMSKDGTAISYEVSGKGDPTLVFIHGWSCDARYWRNQVSHFSKDHQVVQIDLAGHGHSATTRSVYSMKAFGEDVQAVIEAVGSQNVILIGHSMGGAVIAEAARLMPERVKGLIGIDTLENIEYPLKREDFEAMMIPFKNDFQSGTRQFVQSMLSPNSDTRIKEWILSDMAAAPASIALSAMGEYLPRYITGQAAKVFETIKVPVVTVNSDMWPINYEGNRRHMQSFEAIVVKNSDHFLMLNRPKDFNTALKKAIAITLKK